MSVDFSSAGSVFSAIRAIQYSRLATVSIIFFDHVLTKLSTARAVTMFDQEVEHIWKGHWTFINVLYLANRYYALAAAVILQFTFDRFSLAFHQWEGWTGLIFSLFGQIILQTRLYALYALHKRQKLIAVSVGAGFSISTALCTWLMWKNILRSPDIPITIPGGTFCIPPDPLGLSSIYAFWIPIIIFESLLCILAVLPAMQAFLEGDIYFTNSGNLIRVLLRDSLIYFFLIALSAVGCLIGARVAQGIYLDAPVGFSVAMTATMGSRLILNIRGARNSHQEIVDTAGLPLFQDLLVRQDI